MSEMRDGQKYFEKAAAYDMMANYFKYLNPNLHINYYQKHLHYLTKAFQFMKLENRNDILVRQPNAMIRFLHAATDTPNVDVYVNAIRMFKNLPYKHISNYLSLPNGKYHIDIYPTETSVSSILNKKITVESGKIYSVPLINGENMLRLLAYEDQLIVPNGETKVRFIHLSANSPSVDIAVVKGDVVFPKVSYKKATSYLGLTPMTVDLEIREAGTKKALFPLHAQQFKANEVYSIVAVGKNQGEPPFETLLLKG